MNTHGALLDLTGMANDLNQKFDPRSDFCYIYPNGGTEENPANVAINNRYVMDNPFPGYIVECKTELLINNKWVAISNVDCIASSGLSNGISANQYEGDIVVQTAATNLYGSSIFDGNPAGISQGGVSTPTPCRVKVWKIGKI